MKRAFFPTQRTPTISRQPIGSNAPARSASFVGKKGNDACRCTFLIDQCDVVGRNGFVIRRPGVYKVTQDIHFAAKGTLIGAIEIATDNVTIDLCGHTLRGAGQIDGELNNVHGILIQSLPDASCEGRANRNTLRNITIRNGTIENFSGAGIAAWSVDGLTVQSVKLLGNGNNNVARFTAPVFEQQPQNAYTFPSAGLWAHNCSNLLVCDVHALRNIMSGAWYVCEKQCENIRFVGCTFKQTRPGFIQSFALDQDRCKPLAPVALISTFRSHGLFIALSRQCDSEIAESTSLRSLCVEDCKAGDIMTDSLTDDGKQTVAFGFRIFAACEDDYLDSVLFKDCTASNLGGDGQYTGFELVACNSLRVENCHVSDLSAFPMTNILQATIAGFFISDIRALYARGCSVSRLRTDAPPPCVGFNAVLLASDQNALIESCTLQDIVSTVANSIGFQLSGPGKITCRDCAVQDVGETDSRFETAGFVVRDRTSFCFDRCLVQGSSSNGFRIVDSVGTSFADFEFNGDTTDTSVDPGAARFSLNNADITMATQIAVSKIPDAPIAATAVFITLSGESAGPFTFAVQNVVEESDFYKLDVSFDSGSGSLLSNEEVLIIFEDGVPGLQGVLRDNKAIDCALGYRYLRENIGQFVADVALYRNEAICCTDQGYSLDSVSLDAATPIRQWPIGALPAAEVAGAQLDNLDITGCQPGAQRAQRSVSATLRNESLLARVARFLERSDSTHQEL